MPSFTLNVSCRDQSRFFFHLQRREDIFGLEAKQYTVSNYPARDSSWRITLFRGDQGQSPSCILPFVGLRSGWSTLDSAQVNCRHNMAWNPILELFYLQRLFVHHFQGALLLPLLFIQHFPKPFLSRRGCKKSECHGPLHEKWPELRHWGRQAEIPHWKYHIRLSR